MRTQIVWLVLLAVNLLSSQEPKLGCSISGTAVNALTGDRLGKVELRLEPVDRRSPIPVTTSDGDGRFGFAGLEPGRYRFVAKRSGYLESFYGARRADGSGSLLQLDAGVELEGLVFRLTPAAVISGTIRDSDGEPIEDAHVILGQVGYVHGTRQVEGMNSTDTNDRGEYRFSGLTAGRYYIGVELRRHEWNQVDRSARPAAAEVSIPTFYPGVSGLSTAAAVEVAAGKQFQGADITLMRSRVFRVAGKLVNGPPSGLLTLTLRDVKNAAMRDRETTTSTTGTSGEFEFREVPPGGYELTAETATLRGRTEIQVGGSDLEGVRVALAPGAEVKVRAIAEGDTKPDLASLGFFLTANGRNGFGPNPWQEESHTIHNVPPGHYKLEFGATQKGAYVKSAHVKDIDVLESGVAITGAGIIEIEVAVAADGGRVEGVVRDQNQQAVPGAVVVLAPERRLRTDRFRKTSSDQHGHFELADVAPGEYKVFAWEDPAEGAWEDPDFLKEYEAQGERVRVEAEGRVTVNPKLRTQKKEQ